MDQSYTQSLVNWEKTQEIKNDEKWIEYKNWLLLNGCKFPNVRID